MAASSQDAGRAVSDVSTAIVQVAAGADEQVHKLSEAQQAVERTHRQYRRDLVPVKHSVVLFERS